jgi:TPR repeat protein
MPPTGSNTQKIRHLLHRTASARNNQRLLRFAVIEKDDVKAVAQYETAKALAEGIGVDRNLLLARQWYESAANRGHGLAQCEFGLYLARGIGGRDMPAAVKWWEAAAGNGVAKAALNAAMAYSTGDGVIRDLERARLLAEAAANANMAEAFIVLGNIHLEMGGNIQDLFVAKEWFLKAAKLGVAHGQYGVGVACLRIAAKELNDGLLDQINRTMSEGVFVSKSDRESLLENATRSQREALAWFYFADEGDCEPAANEIEKLEKILGEDPVQVVRQEQPNFQRLNGPFRF